MNREDVLDAMYYAKTAADCERAWTLRSAYLRENPNDEEVFEAGEGLSMLEEALLFIQNQDQEKELVQAS